MTEAKPKVLKKRAGALLPARDKSASIEGGYTDFGFEEMYNGLCMRIKELEAQHYMHNLALVEIEAVAPNHTPEEMDDALSARRVAMSDLSLQIERLKTEREKMREQVQ